MVVKPLEQHPESGWSSESERAVLRELASWAAEDGTIRVNQTQVAEATGYSRVIVARAYAELERRGFIHRVAFGQYTFAKKR
jgi:CRP-like cAMP-binding protein